MRLIEFLNETSKPKVKVVNTGNEVFKAYIGRKYVGYVQIYNYKDDKVAPDERYIWKAVVDPGFRRQGVATALYDAAAERLAQQGLKLVPSPHSQLSDDAYAFWKNRNPESLKYHARTLAEPFHKYVGKKITYDGRPAVITKALSDKAFKYQYTDVPEGSANSQGVARWERIQDQLTEQRLTEAGMVSPYAAAKYIAADEDLFDAIASYAYQPDLYDDLPESTKQRFLSILKRVRPFKKRLYRGEPSNEYNNFQPTPDQVPRGFTSWSANTDTPSKHFTDHPDSMVKYTDGPVQAVRLEDIAYWRTVMTDEIHYGSMQAEYFVLEPVLRKVRGINEAREIPGGKHPSQMTWQEFKKVHKTGDIRSDVYDEMVDPENDTWKHSKSEYPVLAYKKNIGGLPLEYRKTGEENKYVKHTPDGEIARDEQGLALYLSPEEMKQRQLATHDETIMVFHGDQAVAVASNEFGAIGVWVRADYQKRGIGGDLLKTFMDENPFMKIGQMTPGGENMSYRAWRKFNPTGKDY